MSAEAIQRVLHQLEVLPDADQEIVLRFLTAVRRHRSTMPANPERQGNNPALELKDGLLVFTGKVVAPETEWLQIVRDERDEESRLVSAIE